MPRTTTTVVKKTTPYRPYRRPGGSSLAPFRRYSYAYSGLGGHRRKGSSKRVVKKYVKEAPGFFSQVGGAIAPALASLVGQSLGGPLGAVIGNGLAHKANTYFGFGDYKVRKNALLEETNGPPRIENRGKEFVVRHREYIQDIYSSSGAANGVSPFNIQGYPLNPGQFQTFPWLSQIATKFEQYRIEGIIFEFRSMYSDAVVTANGALGNVVLATEYNAGQPAFVSKQQMENYEFAQSCKPSCSVIHPIECARRQSVLTEQYVRGGNVPAGEDVKTYDFGDFYIATVGVPLGAAGAAVNLGELWVSYQISFLKPKIQTSGAVYTDSGWFHQSGSSTLTLLTSNSVAPISSGTVSNSSNLGVLVTANTISIPLLSSAMNYLITLDYQDTTQATNWYWNGTPVTGITNGTVLSTVLKANMGAGAYWTSGTAVNTQGLNTSFVVSCNPSTGAGQYCVLTLRNITSSGTGTDTINGDLMINALPLNVN